MQASKPVGDAKGLLPDMHVYLFLCHCELLYVMSHVVGEYRAVGGLGRMDVV